MAKPAPQKAEVYRKVVTAALQLDFKLGHQRWSITQLSRKSGVSRTLIYYYFGKSKAGILVEGVRAFAEEMSFSAEKIEMWKQGRFAEAYIGTRKFLEQYPGLVSLFFIHRHEPTALGEAIREAEKSFYGKLRTFLPGRKPEEIEAMYAFALGLCFAPGVSEKGVRAATAAMFAR